MTRRRPPLPLALLLGVVAVFSVGWTLITPAWQVPDEIAHFAYVQTLGENHRLPGKEGHSFSQELEEATSITNSQPVIFHPYARPEWAKAREREWAAMEPNLSRTNGGGTSPAANYPPLYYAYETIPYEIGSGGSIFTRLGLMRLFSIIWLLVTTTAVWLLAGELFGRRMPQLIAAATAGLWPMLEFVSSGINPDSMLYAWWTLALWQGVVILKRGLTPRRAIAFGGLIGLAAITKVSALVLVPPALLLLAYAAFTARSRRALLIALLGAAVLALPPAAWTGYTIADGRAAYAQAGEVSDAGAGGKPQVREFASYLWQFYLPRLSFMTKVNHHVPVISDNPAFNTWMGMSWGVYGWVSTWFQKWVYSVFAVITGLIALLAVVAALRRRDWMRDRPRRATVLFLAAVLGITVLALHWTDYQFYAAKKGLFMQGRYLFPLVGIAAAIVAYALNSLPARARAISAGVWMGGLFVLQVASLGLVDGIYYAY